MIAVFVFQHCATRNYSLVGIMSGLATSLEKASLVPGPASTLIPSSFVPKTKVKVAYANGEVDMGKLLRRTQVSPDAPSITFGEDV